MSITPVTALAALAVGYLLTRSAPSSAAPAPAPAPKPRPKPRPAQPRPAQPRPAQPRPAQPRPAQAAPLPAPAPPTVKPVVPWPAVKAAELAVLNRPATASTKAQATPAFAVKREDGSAPQTAEAALIVRERNPFDRSYWMPVPRPSATETQHALAMLKDPKWVKGAIAYDGQRTWAGRRQFRAVMHGEKRAVEIWQPKPPFV